MLAAPWRTFAVQVARALGARVTAVDRASKADALMAIGAETVVDFEAVDVTTGTDRFDAVIDVASTRPFADWRRILTPDGTYVAIGHDHFGRNKGAVLGSLPYMIGLMARSSFTPQLPGLRGARGGEDRFRYLCGLVEAGAVTPVVARTFPLEQVVDALAYLTTEEAVGRVVITVHEDGEGSA